MVKQLWLLLAIGSPLVWHGPLAMAQGGRISPAAQGFRGAAPADGTASPTSDGLPAGPVVGYEGSEPLGPKRTGGWLPFSRRSETGATPERHGGRFGAIEAVQRRESWERSGREATQHSEWSNAGGPEWNGTAYPRMESTSDRLTRETAAGPSLNAPNGGRIPGPPTPGMSAQGDVNDPGNWPHAYAPANPANQQPGIDPGYATGGRWPGANPPARQPGSPYDVVMPESPPASTTGRLPGRSIYDTQAWKDGQTDDAPKTSWRDRMRRLWPFRR